MAMQVKNTPRTRHVQWAAAVVSLLVHLALAPNVGLGAGRANAMLCLAAYAALTMGGEAGVIMGFVAGLAYDLTTTGPIGLMALELTVASFVLGREVRNRLADDTPGSGRAFLACACCVELAYAIGLLVSGSSAGIFELLVARLVPAVILDCLLFVPYLVVGSRGNRGGSAFSGGAGSSALGGKRLRG